MYYEAGERAPDALYLAKAVAIGMDVVFALTGKRGRADPAGKCEAP
jgi:hypothetical protein